LQDHEISALDEKAVEEKEDDDLEIAVNKFDDEDDFISFENENENAKFAKHARYARHKNMHQNS
jgi:hypothetical protein